MSGLSVRPFGRFGIDGTGVLPDEADIAVVIESASAMPVAIPVDSATSTHIEAIVPPLLDSVTTAFTSGPVTVQVVQVTASSVMTSNLLQGLTVSPVLALTGGVRAGALTRAYVRGTQCAGKFTCGGSGQQ